MRVSLTVRIVILKGKKFFFPVFFYPSVYEQIVQRGSYRESN